MPVPTLEPAFDVVVRLGPIEDHGVTRVGHRRVVPIVGGTVTAIDGSWNAEILAGGADWQRVRADGAIEIDGRYTARTADDEFVYLQVTGVRSGSPEVLEALLRGAAVPADGYYFRTAISIETASPRLGALEHAVFVASCARDADAVRYVAYRVT
ncbi:DUF3237 domain-containing protein [Microbacterium hominis]|uniref:UPF0311 protein HQM25_02490 n=2 Tax=Microbacterium hominis TaxID=162426 RepID=A0A7D4UKS4_9MICO|nr:DUF3237 domain-containing protein [Microbacterium hominis]